MKKGKNRVLIAIITVIAVVAIGISGCGQRKKEQEAVLNMCKNVTETVPAGITKEKYYPDEQYIKDINCVSLCRLRLNSVDNCYEWTDGFNMTYIMDDSFDQISDAEQYEVIKRVGQSADRVYHEEKRNQYPEYSEYVEKYDYNEDLFGILLMVSGGDEKVTFQTSTNTYEYAQYVDDYFIKNDQEVFIRNEDGHWDGFGTHYCANCRKKAYNSIIGIYGTTEWYCDECYKELMENLEYMQNH